MEVNVITFLTIIMFVASGISFVGAIISIVCDAEEFVGYCVIAFIVFALLGSVGIISTEHDAAYGHECYWWCSEHHADSECACHDCNEATDTRNINVTITDGQQNEPDTPVTPAPVTDTASKYCTNCGGVINSTYKFCGDCGTATGR